MKTNSPKTPNNWVLGIVVAVVLIGLALLFLRNAPTAAPQSAQANTAISAPADAPAQSDSGEAATKKKPTRTPSATKHAAKATQTAQLTPRQPAKTSASNTLDGLIVRNVKIYDLDGNLAYKGDVDLKPTLDRIAKGVSDSHRNDGSTFGNFERKLPSKPRGYYTEYVLRTPGLSGVGPQRIIMGKNDEVYYTPDHYVTFIRVK